MNASDSDAQQTNDEPQSFIGHLLELRTRLLHALLGVGLVFLVLMPFANRIYSLVAKPLIDSMPVGTSMIATEVASPFLAPFKLVMVLSIFISVPWLLYQAWAFVAPGLYAREKRLAAPLLISATLLFYLGAAFAYFVVFPLVFGFLTATAPEGVQMMTDINAYLSFVLVLFLAFGVAFEVPIATVLLVASGMVDTKTLAAKRPYIIVAAFIIGMFLTPPDMISQTLLAVPMWLLFEIGLIASRWYVPRSAKDEDADQSASAGHDESKDD